MNKTLQYKIEKTLDFITEQENSLYVNNFFNNLSHFLLDLLNADYVLINKYSTDKPNFTTTISLCDDSGILPNITYKLSETPCQNILEAKFCSYKSKVQKLFPKDTLLINMNIESYTGIPLQSSAKEPIGLIAVLYKKPIQNIKTIEIILKIIAIRVEQELEKMLFERKLKISQKKNEEKTNELLESDEKFKKLIDSFLDPIYITSPDYKISYQNEAMKRLIKGEKIGEKCYRAIYNLNQKCEWCIYENLKKEKIITTNLKDEYRNKYRTIQNILLDSGSKMSIYHDTTDRKKTELELTESEEKFRAITNSANDAIILIDNSGKVAFWNIAAQQIFGYSKDEILNKDLHSVLPSMKYRDSANKAFAHFRNTGEGNIINKTIELEAIRKNGEIFLIELSLSSLKIKGLWNAICIVKDITNRKKNEQALKKAKQQAEESNRLKSEFLANMSHEIRTPLNAIIGFSEILQTKLSDKKHISFINNIAISGNNLLKLINDILDLSKIEAGQLTIENETSDIRNLIKEIPIIFSELSKQKNIPINIDIDKKIPKFIQIDVFRIKQIILNLVNNAIKFTEKGSVSIILSCDDTFSKSQHKKESQTINFIIEIKDTGIGIPENQLKTIFDSFRQVEGQSTKKYGGTGLGLAISKSLTKLMGGTLSVKSTVGIGSVFTIKLNNIVIPDFELKKIKTRKNITQKLKQSKILHVEDLDFNRELISLYMENDDIEIIEAHTGKQALEILDSFTPDIILMDIQLPGLNGYEITKIIRQDNNLNKIPIIAITANATTEEIEKYNPVFDEYLTKPLSKKDFRSVISKYLKKKS